ncbi:hypothetical protein RJY99_003590 [Vibrio vulnificus]|nr:hypothetical protein [Vibrio vulnificus]
MAEKSNEREGIKMTGIRFFKKLIINFWLAIALLLALFWAGVNIAAHFDYASVNNLYYETQYMTEGKESKGFVEVINSLYYQAFVEGKVLKLVKFANLNVYIAIALYVQFICLIAALLLDALTLPNVSQSTVSGGVAALVTYSLITINVSDSTAWAELSNLKLFHVQELYEFGYWGSVNLWLTHAPWETLTVVIVSVIAIYTLIKSHYIITTYQTGHVINDLKRLIVGCGLAIFAPYRTSIAFAKTQDIHSLQTMSVIRVQTLKALRIRPHTAVLLDQLLVDERTGLIGLTDLSATYITLMLTQNNQKG